MAWLGDHLGTEGDGGSLLQGRPGVHVAVLGTDRLTRVIEQQTRAKLSFRASAEHLMGV